MRLKGIIGSGLVVIGSGIAGYGFGTKNNKAAIVGTFIMGMGALFVSDDHADCINQHAEILNEHEARLRKMEQGR